MRHSTTISSDRTINEVVQSDPRTLPILNARGLDTCCGGPLSLAEAARRHSLDLDELISTLERATAE